MIDVLLTVGLSTLAGTPVQFAAPVRIEAGGAPIDVTTGHAAPYVYDFDGDGVRDLLVGEFGDGEFAGEVHEKSEGSHRWANGRLRIYRNQGSNTAPVFGPWSYLQGGEKTATVPITCCVSFVPQFVDYDNDGIDDVISASYPGDMYWWKGLGESQYGPPHRLMNEDGDVLLPWRPLPEEYWERAGDTKQYIHSTTMELRDMDGDDDLDLCIGSRLDGAYVISNIGTRAEPVWSRSCTSLEDSNGTQIGGWTTGGSNIHWTDWDGDGTDDIVYGGEDGAVRFCRNTSETNVPILAPPVVLIPAMAQEDTHSSQRAHSKCLSVQGPRRGLGRRWSQGSARGRLWDHQKAHPNTHG